jgi:hypothetical protein
MLLSVDRADGHPEVQDEMGTESHQQFPCRQVRSVGLPYILQVMLRVEKNKRQIKAGINENAEASGLISFATLTPEID